jgi:hypothetical protein
VGAGGSPAPQRINMTTQTDKEAKTKFMNIRVTPALMDALKKEAEDNTRTVASQVLHILKTHFNQK